LARGTARFRSVTGDVSRVTAADQIVNSAIELQGRIDILVNKVSWDALP